MSFVCHGCFVFSLLCPVTGVMTAKMQTNNLCIYIQNLQLHAQKRLPLSLPTLSLVMAMTVTQGRILSLELGSPTGAVMVTSVIASGSVEKERDLN